jgi:hypothetical protein
MAFKISQEKRTVVTAVSVVLIVISLVSIYFTQFHTPAPPKVDTSIYTVVGEVAGEETAKVLNKKGKIVVVSTDTKNMKGEMSKVFDCELKAFEEAIKKCPGVQIVARETVATFMTFMMPAPPPLPAGAKGPGPGEGIENPSQWLIKLAKKYPTTNVDAVVLLGGFPMLSDDDIGQLDPTTPRFIVVMQPGIPVMLKKYLDQQIIVLAIQPRMMPPMPPKPGQVLTAREKFEQQYEIVTPEVPESGGEQAPPAEQK